MFTILNGLPVDSLLNIIKHFHFILDNYNSIRDKSVNKIKQFNN
jgi:hypothetical protein